MNFLCDRKQRLCRFQNFLTTQPVGALQEGAFADEINVPLKQRLEFLLHLHMVEQSPICAFLKVNKNIQIALFRKIVA